MELMWIDTVVSFPFDRKEAIVCNQQYKSKVLLK